MLEKFNSAMDVPEKNTEDVSAPDIPYVWRMRKNQLPIDVWCFDCS